MTKRVRARRSPIEHALGEYRDGRMSAEAAAQAAGVSLYEILDRIRKAQIPYRLDDEIVAALDAIDDQDPDAAIST